MVKSEIIKFRVTEETKFALITLQKEWQYSWLSSVVSRLVNLGILYKKDRDREIKQLRDRLLELNVTSEELALRN